MGSLRGKRALITGGATGIGEAISLELMEQGAKIAVHWYHDRPDDLREKAKAIGSDLIDIQGDLTDEATVKRVVKTAADTLGGIDILVNNAGDLINRHTLEEMELSFLTKVIQVNVDSVVLVTREALPYLMKAGEASVVNMASLAGRKGGHGGSLAYATSKGAVITFTRALAAEVGQKGVRVNCVAPGLILGTHFHQKHTTEESARKTISEIPLGRAGNPHDVAVTVAFLASQYDGFITGATLDINGGVYMA